MVRIKKSIAKAVASVTAISFLLVILSGLAVTVPTYYSVKHLYQDLTAPGNASKTDNDTEGVVSSLDRLFWVMNAPVAGKILTSRGLNFGSIDNEIKAVVSHAFLLGGAKRPAKYLVAFQNSAEARGVGGLLGAFAVLVIDKGTVRIERTGSNSSLRIYGQLPVSMPKEFLNLYGTNPGDWRNSNLSPHFPYAAKIWLGLWEKQFKEKLDGVITLDPVAISYLLEATGPVTLDDGEQITSANIVKKTLVDAYQEFDSKKSARKPYLVEILNATAKKIEERKFSSFTLLHGIQRAILENRLLLYSKNTKVERDLESTLLGGSLDLNARNQFRAVVLNIDGSKLDYYLSRSVRVISTKCSPTRETRVKVSFTNNVKNAKSLPEYVLTRVDRDKPTNLVPGQHRFVVFLYGPKGGELLDSYSPGSGLDLKKVSTERGRPIAMWDIDLPPGQKRVVVANFKNGSGPITWSDQPLVSPSKVQISDRC